MAVARLIPSSYRVSSTNLSVTDASNMYTNTDSTTNGTVQNTRSGTSSYYFYLQGFNFDSIPSNAQVSNIAIKFKASHSGGNTGTISCYTYDGTTATSISSAGSMSALTATATATTFSNTTINWSTLKGYGSNFGIRINGRRNSRNTTAYLYIYGAEIEVTYTAETVHVTGVSVSPSTASVEVGSTQQLTETVTPSNATDKSVTWSSSDTSVATVDGSGLVTAVSAGSATITVTTTDGSYTATSAITVTPVVLTDYIPASTMEVGKDYLIVNGNTGTVYMLSNESGGSRQLKGVQATVTNGKISISSSVEAKCLFTCELYTPNDDLTTCLSNNGQYLYVDNASGLRMYTSANNKHWHYKGDVNKFWLFRGTTDGYTDATSEYKYYLTLNASNYFTDAHVDTTSIEASTLPAIYLFKEDDGSGDADVYLKQNGNYVLASSVYKRVSGSWVLQTNMSTVFDNGTNYKSG